MTRLRNQVNRRLRLQVLIPRPLPQGRYILKGSFNGNPIEVHGPCSKNELKIWRKLREMKCPLPWISTSWSLQKKRVLVCESLFDFNAFDSKLAFSEILEQLSFLHQFAVHGSIDIDHLGQLISDQIERCYFKEIQPSRLENNCINRRRDLADLILAIFKDNLICFSLMTYFDSIPDAELIPQNYLSLLNQY